MLLPKLQAEHLLKRTTSRCPVCKFACPAEVWRVDGRPAKVFFRRNCPQHGAASMCIASDARFYWLAQGNPENAGGSCGGAEARGPLSRPSESSDGGSSAAAPCQDACCSADGSRAGTLGRNACGRGD